MAYSGAPETKKYCVRIDALQNYKHVVRIRGATNKKDARDRGANVWNKKERLRSS